MKHLTLFLSICAISLVLSGSLQAQGVVFPADTTQLVSLETKDGNEFVGTIRVIDAEYVIIKTQNFGDVRIRKLEVKSIQTVGKAQFATGEYWYENPHATRYFFGPNGYGLRKGEGYYQNTWIFFNQFSYGFTNNFTVGVGIIPLFIFAGTASPVWITPKVSIPLKKDVVNLGVGGLFAYVLGEESASFGVAYGQLTLGSRDRNFNVGMGYGYAGNDWASSPTVSISGMYRTGKKFALMTENYFFDTGDSNYLLMSLGCRFLGKRLAVDAGLVFPTQTDGYFIGIPWLGLSVPLGHPAS